MRNIVLMSAGFGLVVLIIAWVLHCRFQPYAYQFQNKLESWLLGAATIILLFASMYTFFDTRNALIENLMVFVIIASVLGAFAQVWLSQFAVRLKRNLQKRFTSVGPGMDKPAALDYGPNGTPPDTPYYSDDESANDSNGSYDDQEFDSRYDEG